MAASRWELFDHIEHGPMMVPRSDGNWVRYSDYELIKAKAVRLQKHKEIITGFIRQRNYDIAKVSRLLADARAELESLRGEK